uniref:Transposase Tc1-like domain-containing protein n=1 Tax=Oncorhynchus tshawytscha TaxID=74940 RepID=A0AAZ3RGN1_ONCTS
MKTLDTEEVFLLTLKNTKRKMPRVHAHLRECALCMLQGGMRTADLARVINCNVRTVRPLSQRYRETGRTADHPLSGRPRVTTPAQDRYIRTSHMRHRYRMATTTARVTPGMRNPFISAQTLRNRLREAGLRVCRPVVRQVLTRHHRHKPTVAGPDRTGKKCSSLTSHGFVSTGVMVGFAFIVEGISVTPRPVLCSGIDLEVEGPSLSGVVCHSIIRLSLSSLQANLNAVRYRKDILPHVVPFLQAHPDMTLQHDNATSRTARSVRDFLQDRNVLP